MYRRRKNVRPWKGGPTYCLVFYYSALLILTQQLNLRCSPVWGHEDSLRWRVDRRDNGLATSYSVVGSSLVLIAVLAPARRRRRSRRPTAWTAVCSHGGAHGIRMSARSGTGGTSSWATNRKGKLKIAPTQRQRRAEEGTELFRRGK